MMVLSIFGNSKPAGGVISSEICLCHCRCLPILEQHREFLLLYRLRGSVGGGRCGCSAALRASRHLGTGGNNVTGDGGSLVSSTNHDEVGAGAVQQALNEKQEE
jgi:hypothetical protein